MMIPRFFCSCPLAGVRRIELPPAVAHHAARVLRLQDGDDVVLFDGTGGEYRARLELGGQAVAARVIEALEVERESPIDMILIQGLAAADKMDWIIQKAVELGVRRIVPVHAARSVLRLAGDRAARRVEHWKQIVVAASEQCGRNRLAEVDPVAELERALGEGFAPGAQKLICAPGAGMPLRTLDPAHPIVLVVGPEGGFTPQEEAAAGSVGFRPVTLGPRVLRTETAGVAALAALGALYGDL